MSDDGIGNVKEIGNAPDIDIEVKQIEIELLAYDGRTVLLDVADEAIGELEKIKLGNGATLRVFEEDGKRFVTQFRIRSKDPNLAKVCSEEYLVGYEHRPAILGGWWKCRELEVGNFTLSQRVTGNPLSIHLMAFQLFVFR
ncbi:MAG: hypothetical protein O7F12_15260 [Nitrospirae bacterium]|nr:hypothetical protein [Nitrospirota bacterium]